MTGQGRLGAAALAAACLILNACAGSPVLPFDDEFNGAKGPRHQPTGATTSAAGAGEITNWRRTPPAARTPTWTGRGTS